MTHVSTTATPTDATDATDSIASISAHVLESLADGVAVVDVDGQIVYANRAFHDIAGAVPGTLVGSCVDDLVPVPARGHHAELRASFNANLQPRPMGSGLELTVLRADGTEMPVEISLSPFTTAKGMYVVAAVRDVSERRDHQARLAHAQQLLALIDERGRIGRDLHDVILQRLYGTGLTVQAIAASAPSATSAELDQVVDEIDRIIADIRTIVFTLGSARNGGPLGQELSTVVAQSMRLLGFTPNLRLEGPVESVLSDEARVEMIASMREALGNVARHAAATAVEVFVIVHDGAVTMTVTDDGIGPPADPERLAIGNGLPNLIARAEALGGSCTLEAAPGGGAQLTWSIPY